MIPDGQKSSCPARGIRYQPKTPRKGTPTKGPSEPTAPSTPFTGRGNLVVSTLGQRRGCLISRGSWFTSGTCATFRVKKTSGTFSDFFLSACQEMNNECFLTICYLRNQQIKMSRSPCNLVRVPAHLKMMPSAAVLMSPRRPSLL